MGHHARSRSTVWTRTTRWVGRHQTAVRAVTWTIRLAWVSYVLVVHYHVLPL